MNTKFVEELIKRVLELRAEYAEELARKFKGTPLRHKEPTDEEFVVWFEDMARKDPNWVPALDLCDGGKELNGRYVRLMGSDAWAALVEPYLWATMELGAGAIGDGSF